MIAAGTASMGRATTPTPGPGAQSRWPRAVARLRLALRSPAAPSGSSGRWMGCFRTVPAPSSSAVTVAVKEAKRKGPEVEMEPARGGGEDVWSAQAEAEVAQGGVFPEHLVVMVNGLVGSADDWKFAAQQFVMRMPDKVIVHRSQCNSATQTFDGVDLMGERLANEVLSVVEQRTGVKKISIVAHSLGGLVARYAIGRLYEPNSRIKSSVGSSRDEGEHLEGLIAGLEPMNFITFASPHLGSSGNKQFNLGEITESMQEFVRKMSSFKGAEVPANREDMESVDLDVNQFFKAMESVLGKASEETAGNDTETDRKSSSSDMDFDDSDYENDFAEEAGDKDMDDSFMESYSDALNEELSKTSIKETFSRAQHHTNSEGPSNAADSDGEMAPVDVDLNLVENFLNSYSSQQGLPGPASNLLGLMGVKVPPPDGKRS